MQIIGLPKGLHQPEPSFFQKYFTVSKNKHYIETVSGEAEFKEEKVEDGA